MIFHPTQSLVAKDRTRFRVVNCGRQWGKTTLAIWEMIGVAVSGPNKEVSYYATTFDQARDIAWNQLKQLAKPVIIGEPNNTLLELYVRTKGGGQSRIRLRSWEAVEKARGTQNDFIVLDEVSKMKNFKEGWQAVLIATLAFRRGSALFISTPYGYNSFHDLFQMGQPTNNTYSPDYKSWTFTSFDNPHLDREYLNGVKRDSTEDYFAQEYLAEFRRFTGLIYKEFDITRHVHYFDTFKDQPGDYYFGQDFGVRGFNAAVPIRVDHEGEFWILDNFKKEGQTAADSANEIKTMLELYAPLEKYVGYADPAGWASNLGSIVTGKVSNAAMKPMQWAIADEFLDAGLPITPANNKVTPGITFIRQLFKMDKLHIHPRCTQLIDELMQYQWLTQPSSQIGVQDEPEKVRKINDHLVDAMRYALYSKPTNADEVEKKPDTVFPIQFPAPRIEKEEDPELEFVEPIDNESYLG